MLVALTGGIGSGKSTVSQRLAARGAVIVDADAIVHELQRAGQRRCSTRLAERFGAGDHPRRRRARPAGAGGDRLHTTTTALADLNDIVHPAVRAEIARRIDAERDTDHVVVLDTPLLDGRSRAATFAGVIVVDVPIEVAVERLVR